MKLIEIFDRSFGAVQPQEVLPTEQPTEVPIEKLQTGEKYRQRLRKSNYAKAKRITNLVAIHKRESNGKEDETPIQSNLGGHVSTWLNR